MYGIDKHVCMLPEMPSMYMRPTATFFQRQLYRLRMWVLPCEWHTGTVLYIRSLKRLRLERERHTKIGWYIWHPYSPIKYYWDCTQLIFLFASYIYMPFQVFYNCPAYYDPFILFIDALNFLHLCSRFITGYIVRKHKTIILEPKRIAIHYLKTHFITNLIAALPLQLIRPFGNCEYPTHTAMFIFKLLRTLSLSDQWKNVMGRFQMSYISYVFVKVIIIALMFFHWMTYLHFQVPTICFHIYSLGDKDFREWLKDFNINTHETSVFEKYTTNLYLVCAICIGAGHYMALDQDFIPNFLLSSGIGLIGLVFMNYAFSTLVRLTMYWHFDVRLFSGKDKELEQNMSSLRMSAFLQKKIKLFLNYKFNGHYFNEEAIESTINEQIQQDINLYCCRGLMMNVPMFQDMPVALLNSLIFNLKRRLFMPGEMVVKYGLKGQSLYLISTGTVAVINEIGREVAHLRDGAFFGENALLNKGVLRTATIIALEISEIYVLNKQDFAACLQPYPHLKRMMEQTNAYQRTAQLNQAARQRQYIRRP